jgi:hypothetical protein
MSTKRKESLETKEQQIEVNQNLKKVVEMYEESIKKLAEKKFTVSHPIGYSLKRKIIKRALSYLFCLFVCLFVVYCCLGSDLSSRRRT